MFKSTTFAPAFERERRTRHDDEGKAEEAVTLKYKDEVGEVNHISFVLRKQENFKKNFFSKIFSKTFGDKKKVLTFAATFLTER